MMLRQCASARFITLIALLLLLMGVFMMTATNSPLKATQVQSSEKRSLRAASRGNNRPGLIILGMHRSGTSMVSGLINKMGLKTGGPLLPPADDNPKGFFERVDVVSQNDVLMGRQKVHFSYGMHKFDLEAGIEEIRNNRKNASGNFTMEGQSALAFLNDHVNYPWMLKDPRLCVTLSSWLPFIQLAPAVLFTYRHPMDVAQSFLNRQEGFPIGKSLRMWYVYNRRAIEQSQDLCRVTTSHRAVMSDPLKEMKRIYDKIRRCGVMAPHRLTQAEVDTFVDPKLQHGRLAVNDTTCAEEKVKQRSSSLHSEVMRVYCALEDGSAFLPTFKWDLTIKDRSEGEY